MEGFVSMQTLTAPVIHGNVTLPEEISRKLGVRDDDSLLFIIGDDGAVTIQPKRKSLDDVLGSLPPLKQASSDFDDDIQESIDDFLDSRQNRRGY